MDSATSRVTLANVVQLLQVEEPEPLRLLDHPSELSLPDDLGIVEEGARDARHGDPVVHGHVPRVEPPDSVNDQPGRPRAVTSPS